MGHVSELYRVRFQVNQIHVSFDVNDNIMKDNEEFLLVIDASSLPTNVAIGDPYIATVTIDDGEWKNSNKF